MGGAVEAQCFGGGQSPVLKRQAEAVGGVAAAVVFDAAPRGAATAGEVKVAHACAFAESNVSRREAAADFFEEDRDGQVARDGGDFVAEIGEVGVAFGLYRFL